MSGIFGGGGGTTVVQPAAPSEEEKALIGLQTELSKRQLANVDQLAPYQKQLLDLTMKDLQSQAAESAALDAAISPQERASAIRAEFDRAQKLGPIQDELQRLQLDEIKRGGAATPEQLARIKDATDAGILAGSSDIDASTKRGIGLIADELANSRGLRLSDSPIGSEAALLAREGEVQKGSLVKNMRAAEAAARLNFPLAAGQYTSGLNLAQQNLANSAAQFQADLRQRAFQNRMALSGQTSGSGIGLASIGNPSSALSALSNARGRTTTEDKSLGIGGLGAAAGGIGGLMTGISMISDRRLKTNIVRIGTHPLGFGIYEYDIFGVRDRGVMAQEVIHVVPEAVLIHESGYYMVDYGKLQ